MKNILFLFLGFWTLCGYAQAPRFSQKSLDPVNAIIKNRFAGRTHSFVINADVALYSELSQYMVYNNFNTGKTHSIRLDDSFLYALIFTPSQVAEIDKKQVEHKKAIDEFNATGTKINESSTQLRAFCYYNNHIYLMYSLMNFYGMKTLQSPPKGENKSAFYFETYLVELTVKDSVLTKARTKNLINEQQKSELSGNFSIVEGKPALFMKTAIDKKVNYEYIPLTKAWERVASVQAFPAMMSNLITENKFNNVFTLNTEQHILINNQTRQRMKIQQGTHDNLVIIGAMMPYKHLVYARVYRIAEKSHAIVSVDLVSNTVKELKTFKHLDLYPFPPMFYIDDSTGTLYTLAINDDKQLIIVDSIKV